MAATPPSTPLMDLPMDKSYSSRVRDILSNSSSHDSASPTEWSQWTFNLLKLLRQPDIDKPKIYYTSNGKSCPRVETCSDLVALSADDQASETEAICVIENISPGFIEEIGSAWDLDPEFFIGHAKNPNPEDLWVKQSTAYDTRNYRHLLGAFEYHGLRGQKGLNSSPNYFPRRCFEHPPYSVQSNTFISYYRVRPDLYLFLVDAPLDIMRRHVEQYPRRRPTLRLMYATNRGGVLLPQLFHQARNSLFDSLKAFLQHGWHFALLFRAEGAIPDEPFLYLLSNSLWISNLDYLTKDIHRISFEEVRNPSLKINNALHDRRENLAFMKASLTETIKYMPTAAVEYFHKHVYFLDSAAIRWNSATPIESHQRTLDAVVQLDHFLMETFQLLMSSISLRDTQLSIEQSRRATRLTQLAFIYVPLSFVTGLFGMNVQQINATGLPIWVCFVTLAVIIVLTAGILWCLHARGKKKKEDGERIYV